MKKTRLLALIFNLYSMSAVASYDCDIKLAHMEDLFTTIAEKHLVIEEGEMKSGNMGTLFVELEKGHKRVSLDINAVMSGWKGEEDATFVILRRTTKKRSLKAETLSDVMTVKGSGKIRSWFDEYKIDIDCELSE